MNIIGDLKSYAIGLKLVFCLNLGKSLQAIWKDHYTLGEIEPTEHWKTQKKLRKEEFLKAIN